ncbi:MAG: N-acetyltransferase family protein [Pseudomonadota bacterium]
MSRSSKTRIIRDATVEDAGRIAAIYAPYVADTHYSFEALPPDTAEMRRRMGVVQAGYPWLVCEMDGEIVAYAYASAHNTREAYRWCCEVTVYSDLSAPRQGIGRALYDELFKRLKVQGLRMAYAGISLPHEASVGFHEAFGFTFIGAFKHAGYVDGHWYDVGWWEFEVQPLSDTPDEPMSPKVPV